MNYLQARDEIYNSLQLAWLLIVSQIQPLPANTPIIVWPGQAIPDPSAEIIYGKPNLTVVNKSQISLRRNNGLSLFQSSALFTFQIFAPKSDAAALDQSLILAAAIEAVFCKSSQSDDIWYRNSRYTPVSGTDTMNQINVVSTCVYQTEE